MAFPRFLLKSVGSKWGERAKRDRAAPVCIRTDRQTCVCMWTWPVCVYVHVSMCCVYAGLRMGVKAMHKSLCMEGAKHYVTYTMAGLSLWCTDALVSPSIMSLMRRYLQSCRNTLLTNRTLNI